MLTHSEHAGVQKQAGSCTSTLDLSASIPATTASMPPASAILTLLPSLNARSLSAAHACLALWYLAAQGSLRQRIKAAGGVECVKHAVNVNATAGTKSWGNDLLDKLK